LELRETLKILFIPLGKIKNQKISVSSKANSANWRQKPNLIAVFLSPPQELPEIIK
jgi:hypothetical protein